MRRPAIRSSLKQQSEAISIKLTTAHTHARTSGCISTDPVQSTQWHLLHYVPTKDIGRKPRNCSLLSTCHLLAWHHPRAQGRIPAPLVGSVSSDDTPLSCPSCSLSDSSGSVQGRLSRAPRRPPAHSTPADTGRPARPPDACSSVDKAFPQWGSSQGPGWGALRRWGADQGWCLGGLR